MRNAAQVEKEWERATLREHPDAMTTKHGDLLCPPAELKDNQ
mgnify:CR=1 FL=1